MLVQDVLEHLLPPPEAKEDNIFHVTPTASGGRSTVNFLTLGFLLKTNPEKESMEATDIATNAET